MSEKIDGAEKWVECWDCGEPVPVGSCKVIHFDNFIDEDGYWTHGACDSPCCDDCYSIWMAILENTR